MAGLEVSSQTFDWIQQGRATTVFVALPTRGGINEIIDIACADGRSCRARTEVLGREMSDLPGEDLATLKFSLVR